MSLIKVVKHALAVGVACLALGSQAAQAAPVYQTTFQGVTFVFTVTDSDTLSFRLKGTPSGDWAGVSFLGAFALKDLGLIFDPTKNNFATGTANGPGAVNLAGLNSQLSASNEDCSASGGGDKIICWDLDPDRALGGSPFDITYTLDFSRPLSITSAGIHLQVVFTNTEGGAKVGSLFSQNILLSRCTTPGGCEGLEIPEPGSLALLGAGLAGLALLRRRRRA